MAIADDVVFLATSWRTMQFLLDLTVQRSNNIDMLFNVQKTVRMIFSPGNRHKIMKNAFPIFKIAAADVGFVHEFECTEHITSDSQKDYCDILLEVRSRPMGIRTNIFGPISSLCKMFSGCLSCVV
jgi:hypothetical protein